MEETWTILKVLQWTAGYFSRKGIEQPRANAEVLLAHTLGMERLQLYLHHDQPLTAVELTRYRAMVQRRATREPAQYITCTQEFWSLDFEVNRDVLIPRPETERLVERALELLPDSAPACIFDLGTGSGAIAIALAHERPHLQVLASDRSPAALAVARRNALRHGVLDRVRFVAMDLFGSLGAAPFDLIVSNPPYIGDVEFETLAPEVACHEPRAALCGGGAQGLGVIGRILERAPAWLRPGATLLMEIGAGQAELLRDTLPQHPAFAAFDFIRDYAGIERVLEARRSPSEEVSHG